MKTLSNFAKPLVVAFSVAVLASGAAAATASEVFKAHEADIATNRCVAAGGYVFGVGRAVSKAGGDAAGFGKARILAFGKIADHAFAASPWPNAGEKSLRIPAWRLLVADKAFALTLDGCETILERREAPEHYMAVLAVPEKSLAASLPSEKTLMRYIGLARSQGAAPADKPQAEEYEPRGYWEEGGVKANETLAEGQFL